MVFPVFARLLTSAKLKKITVVCAILAMVGLGGWNSVSAEDRVERTYPLPLTELETVVSFWLADFGFVVQRSLPRRGQVILAAQKSDQRWRLVLSAHSPLVSRLEISARDGVLVEPLFTYLGRYSRRIEADDAEEKNQGIPAEILSKVESIACIKGRRKGRNFQFTGFVIDEKGLLLCTGHDLELHARVLVDLNDERTLAGTVIKLDSRRDLALISISTRWTAVVDLNRRNDRPEDNEQLFSVGCPLNVKGVIHVGRLQGTPRRLRGVLLRQMDMTIQQGSSGSPVFDGKGNLVGIVKGRFRGTNDIGFLIPIPTIMDFMKEP